MTARSRIPLLGPRGEGWLLLQLVLLLAILVAGLVAGGAWPGTAQAILLAVGVALVGGGLGLAAMGVRDLRSALSPLPHPMEGAPLITTGIYGRMRHPIYTGLVLAALGWSLAAASLVALVLVPVLALVLDLKSRREELFLRARFAEYVDYAARTKRFIPGVY